ncbi:MAG: PKD domain-containing protein [Chitinophagaceae bacterium]
MLRLNRPVFLMLACCTFFISKAQTNSCSAKFSFVIGNDNVVAFYASDTLGVKHRWLFGDGSAVVTTSSGLQTHQFSSPGTYQVKHYMERPGTDCRDSSAQSITIIAVDKCSAGFYFQRQSSDSLLMHFFNKSVTSNGIKKFSWNFGDSSTSNLESPLHNYAKAGTYNVCLSIETNSGCSSQVCQQVVVIDSIGTCNILASFQYGKDNANCKKVYFYNTTKPSAAQSLAYAWNFGDGSSSHDANPTHEYANAGRYAVCLVVEAGNNCRKVFCDSVMVSCGTDSCILQPSFTWKASSSTTNISFTSTINSSANNIAYAWTFGDSSAGSHDANPIHTYSKPGTYNVCLVVETSTGCRKQVCMQLTIAATTCNISARFEKHREASQLNAVYFSNVSQPVNNIWQTYWTYGDSSSSRDYNSLHTYSKSGTYSVCLKVIGLSGCVSTYCDTVIIQPVKKDSCKINNAYSHYNVTGTPLAVRYEALYNSNTADYSWSFGDGNTGSGRMPTHTYSKAGNYIVCLRIKEGNCVAEKCDTITVQNNNGRVAVSPNPAVNTVALEIKLDKADRLSIRFMDASGGIRSSFTRDGNTGNNRFVLPVDKLSQGIYLVEIKSYNGAWYSRFVKG